MSGMLGRTGIDKSEDWSALEVSDLKSCARCGITLEGSAALLKRPTQDVAKKAEELGVVLKSATADIPPRQ